MALEFAYARVAELADAQDLKSCEVTLVPVRFRSRAHSKYAQIAQLVEQRTENPRVTGSIPVLGIFYLNFKKVSTLYGAETFFGG